MIVAFRRHTLPPLDDYLFALQPMIQRLTRSSLHRCLQRHGISRLPDIADDLPHLFFAIYRTENFMVARLMKKANRKATRKFLELLR